jgi:hypothetical protein
MARRRKTAELARNPDDGMLPLPYAVGVLVAMALAAWIGIWLVRRQDAAHPARAARVLSRN